MNKHTKKALLASVLSLILCVSMLIGTTFAWFTDSVTTGVNTIQSGTLDIVLEYKDANGVWQNAEGQILDFVKAAGAENEPILWEPGCTYNLPELRLRNNGNLALKYSFAVTGVDGNAKLLKAIEWKANEKTLTDFYGTLLTKDAVSETIKISGHMLESAGNEYQGLTIDGIGITVFATQLTHESDSFDNQYDLAAPWTGFVPATLADTTLEVVPGGGTQTGTITINSAEDLVYLNKLAEEWVSLYSNGQGTNVGSYRENAGGKGTDYYYYWTWDIKLAADLDMNNIPMDSINLAFWDTFDGNGHSIINVALKDGQTGLFNNAVKAISNLTVKNITVNAPGAQKVGAIAGSGALNNVHVENATVVGGKYVGGLIGKGSDFVNCSIKNATVTGDDKTIGGLAGYSIGDPGAATVSGNIVENVTVTGAYNVGGLLGQSQNETVENNTVKNVTVKSTKELPANASANEVRTAQLAARSDFANTTIGANTVEDVTIIEVANVTTTDALNAALDAGAVEVRLSAGTYTFPASKLSEGDVIVCDEGTKFESGARLNIGGATVIGATFDGVASHNTVNGTFKDCEFNGSNALRYGYAGDTVVFENCTFNGSVYGAHFDSGANEVIFKDCTLSGFNAMGAAVTKLTMEGCTFKALGKSNYNGINLWGDTDMINCTFVFDGSTDNEWVDLCNDNKTVTFTGCVVTDGTTETPLKDVVGNYGDGNTIIIDGVTVDIPNMS